MSVVLPVFAPGAVIVVEERWRGLLWSAEPHRVVASSPAELVTWMPAGTVAVRASNRDLAGLEQLSREQRKLTALADCRVRPTETVETPNKLYFWRAGRWSRINLGWDPASGSFMGWYVNFEQPVAATTSGIWGKDLVLDLLIAPDGSSTPKDVADFDEAIAQGIVPDQLRDQFAAESAIVHGEVEAGSGPFTPDWRQFRPNPTWVEPVLPASHKLSGPFWDGLGSPARPDDVWTVPIVTDRTLVRSVCVADVDALASLATDPQVRTFLGGPRPPSDAYERADARAAAGRPGDLVVQDRISTDVIGHIEVEAQADRWELSYEFSPAVWGQGIAYEAIQAALQRLHQQHPDARVVAETQTVNSRSLRLLHRLGFAPIDTYNRKGAEQILYVAG